MTTRGMTHRFYRQKCRHGICREFAKEGSFWCEYHEKDHLPKSASVYESSIKPIPLSRLMAGRA